MSATVPQAVSEQPSTAGRIRDLRLAVAGRDPTKRYWIKRRFASHAVGLVISGRGRYRVDREPWQDITAGSLFAVYPDHLFEYGPEHGTTWHEVHLGGLGPGVERWLRYGWIDTSGRVGHIPTDRLDWFDQQWDELLRYRDSDDPGDRDRLVLQAERILLELTLLGGTARTDSDPDRVSEAIRSIRLQAGGDVDFQAVAAQHHISYSLLRQQVKRRTGLSPAKYVTELRCDHACRLLTESDASIEAVAIAVGYHDAPTFSKAFARTVGLPPSNYRQASRQHRPAGE